jgi:transcriptional regulator with PAS, ATPase and Fis domain
MGRPPGSEDTTEHADRDPFEHQRMLVVVGPDHAATYPLPAEGTITIGRSHDCEVRVDHPSISRRHLAIHVAGDAIEVEDLGSANGSRYREQTLAANQRVRVHFGEVIDVGAVMLIVQERGDAAVGAPATTPVRKPPVIGESMIGLDRVVQRVAEGNICVLIVGETGAGKEVLATRIHELSPRRARPFVRINCAALSESLLESELFGHERGSFTGADRAKPGLLATAIGGTVLLDEIGELAESIQVKLLRVLEQREILPVGGLEPVPIDVRFVAATNRDLELEVRRGGFRQDLYFRIAGVTLRVPPLRQRVHEIPALAKTFIAGACRDLGRARPPELSDDALRWLTAYAWPGNIRELRNVIERAVLLCTTGTITAEHLPANETASAPPAAERAPSNGSPEPAGGLRDEVERIERERILAALDACGGNQTRAARQLGISRSKLVSRIEQYGIKRPRKRDG